MVLYRVASFDKMVYFAVFLFSVTLCTLAATTLANKPVNKDCAQHFNTLYQDHAVKFNNMEKSEVQPKWSFEDHYDYFGNRTGNPPLVRTDPFTVELEREIDIQINKELFCHYTFLSMAFHFRRDDIYLPGFRHFFKRVADEEMRHAHMFMEYLLQRGGRIRLNPIMTPCQHHWGNGLMAMENALVLQKELLKSLRKLHSEADSRKDAQMMDFIEANFLSAQIELIQQLSNHIGTLQRLRGEALGEYQFDKLTLGGGDK